jgi:phospholipase C
VGVGFDDEEDPWLANFGDNPIEYFTQYHVKLSPEYIANIPKAIAQLVAGIKKREQQLPTFAAGSKESETIKGEIEWLNKRLAATKDDQKNCTPEKFEQLSAHQKSLHGKAFSTNRKDPFYHQLAALKYNDGNTVREVKVPKGDILQEFRDDVKNGKLPVISWIVAPQNFSDHPSSAWYGAWYISEVMDILTQNPEVWKKTIFILTYDENDGYFDHVSPFVAPHPYKKETGLVSPGINTLVEYVANAEQQSVKDRVRESPIGLGYRVPLVVASPWSRGGWVNSQVFDHTSSLQFLEKFLSGKFGKKIEESNISAWRRTVCGDLTSVFRTYHGEKLNKPEFLDRDEFIESIHKAQFRNVPSNYKTLTKEEIARINKAPHSSPSMASQEKGIRSSCALPYELYADGHLSFDKQSFEIKFHCGNKIFGSFSAGSAFQVHAPASFRNEPVSTRDYAVLAGDYLKDNWPLSDFENGNYHLRVYGPNGFFREFSGNKSDPFIEMDCKYQLSKTDPDKFTGNITLAISNPGKQPVIITITDNAYEAGKQTHSIEGSMQKKARLIAIDTSKSYGWYDFTVRIKDNSIFERRYAGRVETGLTGKTDPFMGRVI